MTPRARTALAALAVVALALLAWSALVAPARQDAADARAARDDARAREGQVRAGLAAAEADARRAPANARRLRRLAVAVPAAAEPADVLDQLDGAARASGVSLRLLEAADDGATAGSRSASATAADASATTPGGASDAAAADARPVPLTVEVTGGYVGVAGFLERVQDAVRQPGARVTTDGRLLRVDAMDLEPNQKGGRGALRGTLRVRAFVAPAMSTTSMADAEPAK